MLAGENPVSIYMDYVFDSVKDKSDEHIVR